MCRLERRIAAICQHYEINQSDLGGRLFVNSGRDTPLVIATRTKDGVTIVRPVVDALIAAIHKHKIDVNIVDPFISSHQVLENDNGGIDQVIKEWGRVADATDTAIEHAHHVRKLANGTSEIDENDGRGASSAKDGWRSVRVLNGMSEVEARDAGIKGKQRRSYFRTDIPKGNMFVAADKATWHKFVSIELGNGTDDYPDGDKIGVVTKWEMPGTFDGASGHDIGKIQAMLSEQEWAASSQAEDWVGHAIAEVTGLNVHDEKDNATIKKRLKAWLETGVMKLKQAKIEGRGKRTRPIVIAGTPV
jgi:hypothetical protein